MTESILQANDEPVILLRGAISDGGHGLAAVPGWVRVVIRDELWRDRIVKHTRERVQFDSFRKFVETPALAGLGCPFDMLERMCGDDPETLTLLRDAVVAEHGGDRKSQNFQETKTNNISLDPEIIHGTGRVYTLDRLQRKRPDLYKQVIAKKLSPNAAAIEAGFRVHTASVPLTVQGVYRAALKLSPTDQDEVLRLLAERAHA